MSRLSSRIGNLERSVGGGGHCPACSPVLKPPTLPRLFVVTPDGMAAEVQPGEGLGPALERAEAEDQDLADLVSGARKSADARCRVCGREAASVVGPPDVVIIHEPPPDEALDG